METALMLIDMWLDEVTAIGSGHEEPEALDSLTAALMSPNPRDRQLVLSALSRSDWKKPSHESGGLI